MGRAEKIFINMFWSKVFDFRLSMPCRRDLLEFLFDLEAWSDVDVITIRFASFHFAPLSNFHFKFSTSFHVEDGAVNNKSA